MVMELSQIVSISHFMSYDHQLRGPAMIQSNRGNLHQSLKLENIHEAPAQSPGQRFSMNESNQLLNQVASVFCLGFSASILLVQR